MTGTYTGLKNSHKPISQAVKNFNLAPKMSKACEMIQQYYLFKYFTKSDF
jgi:hypothetical protein